MQPVTHSHVLNQMFTEKKNLYFNKLSLGALLTSVSVIMSQKSPITSECVINAVFSHIIFWHVYV